MTTTTPAVLERVSLPLAARRLAVVAVEDLTPTLRRVLLGGPDLAGIVSHGPADHVKLFLPTPDGELVMPVLADGRWTNRDDARLTYRDYTVRTFTPGAQTLAIEMVVGDHGPAGRWAAQAAVGQELGLLGPRGSMLPPMDRDRYVLAVDETGLPALRNWLDRLPSSASVRALVEVGSPQESLPLTADADLDVTWLYRGAAEAGTTASLASAVATTLPDDVAAGAWFWAAAEAAQVRAVRTLLREAGVDAGSSAMTGYWRRGVANFDHHSPDA